MLPCSLPLVVLVEDSDDDAFFFQRALRKCGHAHSVPRLNDGAEALRSLETRLERPSGAEPHSPPLPFLDLKLPVFSGFEILQGLTERDALKLFTISIVIGSQADADVARATELGVTDYRVNPISGDMMGIRLAGRSTRLAVTACE